MTAEAQDTGGGNTTSQDISTDEDLVKVYGKVNEKTDSLQDIFVSKLKHTCKCSGEKVKKIVNSTLPITYWLPRYKIKENLPSDLAAGITVGIVHLPQGMAYGILANLPPVTGLYVSFFPVLMYVLFGTTRHLSIGTFAVISLMVAGSIDKNVPPSYCGDGSVTMATTMSPPPEGSGGGGNATAFFSTSGPPVNQCEQEYERRKIEVAIALSLAVAIINFVMYILRLGIVTIYLSSHMVSGFTCGAAFHVMTSQVPKLLGLDIPRKTGLLALIYTYIDVFKQITTINWATVIVSACCIIPLVIGKEINLRYKKHLPFPIPWELGVVIFSTVASQFAYLNLNYGVSVVGDIPQGIITSVPKPVDLGLVIADAIPIAIVTFSISISLSRLFSEKHGYNFNSNQELLAFSAANLLGSFFRCYPSATSLSRTVVWDETGGKTQITGLISSIVVLIILLWIGPLFQMLPEAALAAIIVVNLKRMLSKFEELKPLWQVSKLDAVTWCITWLAVILLGVDYGLYVGVGFSLLTVIFRTQITHGYTMVPVGDTGVYRSSKRYIGDPDRDDILVFKFPTPLIYANQERFKSQLCVAMGFKPALETARRRKLKLKAEKRRAREKKMEMKKKKLPSTSESVNKAFEEEEGVPEVTFPERNGDVTKKKEEKSENVANDFDNEVDVIDSTDTDNQSQAKFPSHVILDMSVCSFIDSDGVKTIKSLFGSLAELNVKLLLAQCSADVRNCLKAGNFHPDSSNEKPVFFISLAKAINYATSGKEDGDENDVIGGETSSETTRI